MTISKWVPARIRVRAGMAVAVLAGGLLSVPALTGPSADAAEAPETTPGGGIAAGAVTLVTGDRVTAYDNGQVTVAPDPARASITYTTYQRDGQVYVVPSDAAPLLASGQLDPLLFNVTMLDQLGYHDHPAGGDLPLIVTHVPAGPAPGVLAGAGLRVTRELPTVSGAAVSLDQDGAAEFWRALAGSTDGAAGSAGGVEPLAAATTVWLDRTVRVRLADSVPQVGAPPVWDTGLDGTGTTVAVLDTGIDGSHPDLAGKVVGQQNFTGEPDADLNGHGTHVAATVAGTGAASGGSNVGVAPGASLLDGKVCDQAGDCFASAIIEAMQWAAEQGADVVNLSVGGPDSPGVDPLEAAVDSLTASHGTLFVVAAGNTGGRGTVSSPATADAALAVGAVNSSDVLAGFSSQGPRAGDAALKPEITAPGVEIDAARSQDSDLPGDAYTSISGTSMATPHVSGAAAILSQQHPDWSPELRKAALLAAASPDPTLTAFAQGAGRLEVGRAVAQPVTTEPAAVSLGQVEQGGDDSIARTVTYHNHGTEQLTLSLDLTTVGPDGPAPAGMFGLDADTVTVPAGATASVTLTTTAGAPGPAGLYSGWIIASAGDTVVRTPFGLERAIPLTFDHVGRDGGPPVAYNTFVMRVDGSEQFILSGEPGPATVWVPDGTYLVTSTIIDVGPDGEHSTVLTIPRLDAGDPQSFTLDARLAQQVDVAVPDGDAQLWAMELGFQLALGDSGFSITTAVRSGTAHTGSVGANGPVPGFRTKITSNLIVPGPDGDEHDAPHSYHLGWFVDEEVPTGFAPAVTAADLASVTARHAAHVTDGVGYKVALAQPADGPFASGITFGLPLGLPFDRTERYFTGEDVGWVTRFSEHVASSNAHVVTTQSSPIRYAAGSSQEQWWNRPVYGPVFAAPVGASDWVSRTGNQLRFLLPLFGDGDGHAGRPDGATVAGEITITRDGEVLHEGPYEPDFGRVVEVPPQAGTYQLAATAQRSGPASLATQVNVLWTFQSATTSGDTPVREPLWTVALTPPLDQTGTAPAGESFTIPVLAQPQPGSGAAALAEVEVEFSADDGLSWQPATVSSVAGGGHLAELTHPNQAGFVSLRARAVDAAGNAVEQEVIRAYRIG